MRAYYNVAAMETAKPTRDPSRSLRVKHHPVLLKRAHNLLPAVRSGDPIRKRISHGLVLAVRTHECAGWIQQDIRLIVVFTLHLDFCQQLYLCE